jgi:hypothetical protein
LAWGRINTVVIEHLKFKIQNMRYLVVLFIFFLSLPFTCAKHDNDPVIEATGGMKIVSGFACGWGSGEDSLIITSSEVRYYYYVPATSPDPKIIKSRAISEQEWNEIQNAVDFDSFLKLSYNSCNICVDGCDEWIIIASGNITHQIRYGKGTQISEVSKLQEILAGFRSEFSQ